MILNFRLCVQFRLQFDCTKWSLQIVWTPYCSQCSKLKFEQQQKKINQKFQIQKWDFYDSRSMLHNVTIYSYALDTWMSYGLTVVVCATDHCTIRVHWLFFFFSQIKYSRIFKNKSQISFAFFRSFFCQVSFRSRGNKSFVQNTKI